MNFSRILVALLFCAATLCAQETVTNIPPPVDMLIDANGSREFLGFTNVYLTRRAESSVSIRMAFISSTDAEGEELHFFWLEGDMIVSELQLRTNVYARGLHTVHAAVSDSQESVHVYLPLEILSPLEALWRLRADLELTGVREDIAALRPLLRSAERALERRDWRVASRRLQRFDERLSEHIDANTAHSALLLDRWSRAARVIETSVGPRRSGPIKPPIGPFPGPG
jgi:hypothetical protein